MRIERANPPSVVISRRHALKSLTSAVGALVICARFAPMAGARSRSPPQWITAWIKIRADNSITLIASQSEMGQGITTTLAAALADELDLPWQRVRVEFSGFAPAYRDPVYGWMFTGNSQSISSFYEVMHKMGAAAREMLTAAAAQKLNVGVESLHCLDGTLRHQATHRSVTFGEVAAAASQLPVPTNPRLRPARQFEGHAIPRWDIPAKVDGSAKFGIDMERPGMLAAAVRCTPRFGARIGHIDRKSIEAKPGVLAVVEVPGGLAVVAKTYWQARRALDIAQISWRDEGSTLSNTEGLPISYHEKLASGPFFVHLAAGDASKAIAATPNRLEATYEVPFQAHATMEPMNCTAYVTRDSCEIWAPVQGVELAQFVAAQVTGLPSEKILVHRTLIGGGFGRRLLADFVKQALLVAMAVHRPVKVIWSREEDMTHDYYRPAMLHRVTAALDNAGSVVGIAHRVVSPSHMLYIFPRGLFPQLKDWTTPAAPPEKMDTMAVEGLLETPYAFANQFVEQHRLDLDVPVSVWRTTGHGPNNFVLESFIDELAAAAGTDPLEFRRALLAKSPRPLTVLETLAEKSNWSAPLKRGRARGLAIAAAFGGVVASSVELTVADSRITIHRVVAVVDCGRTLDPGIATSNILGGIVWGLSGLRTAVTFDRGCVQQSNFDSFVPLHLWETPPCEVHFVESGERLGGTGELGPVPVHAAVCNAIYAATGKRIRSLPLTREGFSFA